MEQMIVIYVDGTKIIAPSSCIYVPRFETAKAEGENKLAESDNEDKNSQPGAPQSNKEK